MSNAVIHPNSINTAAPAMAAVRRFAWKELRVLRGLWLAVFVLGVLVQLALNFLTPPALDNAAQLFAVALAAAVLYAAGAAATIFSVEHEEETYGFLCGLPIRWWPPLVGKLIVALVSAAALAALLAVAGWLIGSRKTPAGNDAGVALGLFGVGIVEAIAWGTLFSLLTKRPLVAALLTLVVGVTATQLAVNFAAPGNAATGDPAAYSAAIPLRMAIVTIVLGCATLVARRWLTIGARPAHRRTAAIASQPAIISPVTERVSDVGAHAEFGSRRRMLARLLWQTWRESWKLLLLPMLVAALLTIGASLSNFLIPQRAVGEFATAATLFFAPALYGALVFAADQRRGSYRFLAEHAAWPRYVWFARHIVWLGTMAILGAVASAVIVGLTFAGVRFVAAQFMDSVLRWNNWGFPNARAMVFDLYQSANAATQGASLAGYGILAAYGIGQLWSMLVRSQITAAFVSLVLAAALAAWVAVLFVWQLPGSMFLLPIFAGLMLATWLRAPDWITERRAWPAWWLPALAVAASFVLVCLLLPVARLAQLPTFITLDNEQRVVPDVAITNQLDWYREGDSPEARETAAMYERAANLLDSWQDNDLLDRWSKPEYLLPVGDDGGDGKTVFGIDVSKIPPNERAAFRKAVGKWTELDKATEAAIQLVTKASLRPVCRFDFNVGQAQPVRSDWRRRLDLNSVPLYRRMNELLDVVLISPFNPGKSPKNLFVALRMSRHLRSGQPSAVFISQLHREQQILEQIGQWALHDERTKAELSDVAEQLHEYFDTSYFSPDENLIADHLIVDDVLAGKIYPLVLAAAPDDKPAYLAYLANQFGWERLRGERALGIITLQNIDDANQLTRYLGGQRIRESGSSHVRRWLRPEWYGEQWPEEWLIQEPAAATSYLTRFEYQARVRLYELYREICDATVYRRAAILKIALVMFRLEHDEYPKSLAELLPNYLDLEPIDPYSGQPFQYEPAGLDLPMRRGAPDFRAVDPGTPLFWSVGAGNAQLEKRLTSQIIAGKTDQQDESFDVAETYYVLSSSEEPWWNDPAFVFPLSK